MATAKRRTNTRSIPRDTGMTRRMSIPAWPQPHNPPTRIPITDTRMTTDCEPPQNPRYPDSRIYGITRRSARRPTSPTGLDHACFKPRKEDYKPPVTCADHDDDLCVRKDHRALTTDEQNRSSMRSARSTS
jgi:hypothetical protein